MIDEPPISPAPAPTVPTSPLTPGTVVTVEHHNAVVSLLGKIGRGLAVAAQPENLQAIAADVQILLTLFGKRP